jgi:hypothetical protein
MYYWSRTKPTTLAFVGTPHAFQEQLTNLLFSLQKRSAPPPPPPPPNLFIAFLETLSLETGPTSYILISYNSQTTWRTSELVTWNRHYRHFVEGPTMICRNTNRCSIDMKFCDDNSCEMWEREEKEQPQQRKPKQQICIITNSWNMEVRFMSFSHIS